MTQAPDAEPHVRWCGRKAGAAPPPTRFCGKRPKINPGSIHLLTALAKEIDEKFFSKITDDKEENERIESYGKLMERVQ